MSKNNLPSRAKRATQQNAAADEFFSICHGACCLPFISLFLHCTLCSPDCKLFPFLQLSSHSSLPACYLHKKALSLCQSSLLRHSLSCGKSHKKLRWQMPEKLLSHPRCLYSLLSRLLLLLSTDCPCRKLPTLQIMPAPHTALLLSS